MGGELLAAAAPPAKLPSSPSSTLAAATDETTTLATATDETTTLATATDETTTISSLGQGQLLEILLRLPNLRALVRAALTCRSWIGAVRSSPSFCRLFRELHPAPLIGIFFDVDDDSGPSFAPVRRTDPDVAAALRRGDFLLTSLPLDNDANTGWTVTDCRDGYILLWNKFCAVAAVNPMTLAVDIIPLPDEVEAGSGLNFGFLGFLLPSSDKNPSSFRVVCVCKDQQRVRAAVFKSETSDWVVHPWVEIGGDNSLKYGAGTLVDGSVYWPFHGEARLIRINTGTMDVSSVDLPSQLQVNGCNCKAGETKDGELYIVYASDDFLLNVWIRSVDSDGIMIWVRQNIISLSAGIARVTPSLEGDLGIVQVRSGYVYFTVTHITPARTLRCWFSLSLETMEIELLIHGGLFDGRAYPYVMAWPRCLVGDDASTGHEVVGSH